MFLQHSWDGAAQQWGLWSTAKSPQPHMWHNSTRQPIRAMFSKHTCNSSTRQPTWAMFSKHSWHSSTRQPTWAMFSKHPDTAQPGNLPEQCSQSIFWEKALLTQLNQATYPSNVLKAFSEMGLHSSGVFGLWQDLQQLVVRQEVESWEGISLGLQILAEAFLHLLQEFVALTQVVQQSVVGAQGDHLWNIQILFSLFSNSSLIIKNVMYVCWLCT